VSEPGATVSNASQVAAAAAEQGYKDRLKQLAGQILSDDDATKLGIASTTTVTPTAATNLVSVHLIFFSLFLLFKSVFCCCLCLSVYLLM